MCSLRKGGLPGFKMLKNDFSRRSSTSSLAIINMIKSGRADRIKEVSKSGQAYMTGDTKPIHLQA